MSKNSYSAVKSQHVQKEMGAGKSNQEANRSWSHGNHCPMKQFESTQNVNSNLDNPSSPKGYGNEWQDWADTADDL